jgi:hypothetical protein
MRHRGPPCSVCGHPRRSEIDADSRGYIRTAKAFGIAPSSLQRHRKHAPKRVTLVIGPGPVKTFPAPAEVPVDARTVALKTLVSLEGALSRAEPSQVAPLANAIARQTQFLARLSGEFELTESMIVRSRPFRDVMARISAVLKLYPDAQRALAASFAECL